MLRLIVSGVEMPLLSSPIKFKSLSRSLVASVDSCKIDVINPPVSVLPMEEKEAYVYDDSTLVFGGKIRTTPKTRIVPQMMQYSLTIDSWESELDRYHYAGVFSGSVKDNVDTILSGTGLSGYQNCIDPELIVGKLVLEASVLSILTEFAALNKAIFFITPDRKITMQRYPVSSSIEYNVANARHYKDSSFSPSSTQLVSVIKVRNARILSQTRVTDMIQVADGTSDIYHINYQYQDLRAETSPDGISWTELSVGIEYIDNDTEYDVMYSFQSYYLRFPVIPSSGTQIRVSGFAYYDFFTDYRDEDTIATLAALTGGDGIYEYLTTASEVDGLKSGMDVINYCRKIIQDRKNIKISGKLVIEQRYPIPDPIGQTVRVSHPDYGISDSNFIISKYTCRYTRPMWEYTISLDTALFGLEYILASLMKKRASRNESDTLSLARSHSEVISLIEDHHYSLFSATETFNFDDNFGHSNLA